MAPKVFISYSHDSDLHKQWVVLLSTALRNNGIDASLDVWDLLNGADINLFMEEGILNADRVILVCSDKYVKLANSRTGGVGYEARLAASSVASQQGPKNKFIPIIRDNLDTASLIPRFLGSTLHFDFRIDDEYDRLLEDLIREIHGAPANVKPPLGPRPNLELKTSGRTTQTFITDRLSEDWFRSEGDKAKKGIERLYIKGFLEFRSAIEYSLQKSQIELRDAVIGSEINTFGSPIGIVESNHHPRPSTDGIVAEVSIADGTKGIRSYVYWSLRSNGDFYLLQSFFEDSRREKEIFVDTRMAEIAERLMFANKLYRSLGATPETKIIIRATHSGLTERRLSSFSPNLDIKPETCDVPTHRFDLVRNLEEISQNRADCVRELLQGLFILFHFSQFSQPFYEETVSKFERGLLF